MKDSNVTILHYGRPSKETTQTSASMTSTNGSAPSEKSPNGASAETENQLKKREATLLNSALRVELNREASFYLSTMDGIIEGGKHFIPGKATSSRKISSTSPTNHVYLSF